MNLRRKKYDSQHEIWQILRSEIAARFQCFDSGKQYLLNDGENSADNWNQQAFHLTADCEIESVLNRNYKKYLVQLVDVPQLNNISSLSGVQVRSRTYSHSPQCQINIPFVLWVFIYFFIISLTQKTADCEKHLTIKVISESQTVQFRFDK